MRSTDITKLKNAIWETNGCDSRHVKSVPVTEIYRGEVVWDGTVEVFDLIDHPKAQRAYAWSCSEGREEKTTVVLGRPPVDSAHSAVLIAVAAKASEHSEE
jgi:hypothetical protein